MIFTITTMGILSVFIVEYFIQKHESQNLFGFLKSVSLFKTIEQILIVVLSATIAILLTSTAEKQDMRENYSTLLQILEREIKSEDSFLYSYVQEESESEYLQNASDDMFDALLKTYDYTEMIEIIIHSDEAMLTLGPYLYSQMIKELNERKSLLEALYTDDVSVYGNRTSCLAYLDNNDIKLEMLVLYQQEYLKGRDDWDLYSQFMDMFYTEKE